MYNKKVLIDSLKKLGSAKAPTQKKDMIVDPINQSTFNNGLSVKKSNIHGNGLFAEKPFKKGDLIGLAHVNNQPTPIVGNYHNHSEDNATALNISNGNKRYLVAARDLEPGNEITTNYRLQPELGQPEDFAKGGSAPRIPKTKSPKSYSRSLDATNRLFAEHPFFAKPKSRKNKIYDPNSKYYNEGGEPCSPGYIRDENGDCVWHDPDQENSVISDSPVQPVEYLRSQLTTGDPFYNTHEVRATDQGEMKWETKADIEQNLRNTDLRKFIQRDPNEGPGVESGYLHNNIWTSPTLGLEKDTIESGYAPNQLRYERDGQHPNVYFIKNSVKDSAQAPSGSYTKGWRSYQNKTLSPSEYNKAQNEVGQNLSKQGYKGENMWGVGDEDQLYQLYGTEGLKLKGAAKVTPETLKYLESIKDSEEGKRYLAKIAGISEDDPDYADMLMHYNTTPIDVYAKSSRPNYEDIPKAQRESDNTEETSFLTNREGPVNYANGGLTQYEPGGYSDEPPGSKKKPYKDKNAILPRWMPKGMVKAIQNTEVGISPYSSNIQSWPTGLVKDFANTIDVVADKDDDNNFGKYISVSRPGAFLTTETGLGKKKVHDYKQPGWTLSTKIGKAYNDETGDMIGSGIERWGNDAYDARWNEYYEDLADYNAGTMAPSMLWNGDGKGWDPEKNKPKYDGKLMRGLGKAMQKAPVIGGVALNYHHPKLGQPHGYNAGGHGKISLDFDPNNQVGLGLEGGIDFYGGNRYQSKNYRPGNYRWNISPSVTGALGTRPHFGFNVNAGIEGLPKFMPKKFPGYFYGNANYNQSLLLGTPTFSFNVGYKKSFGDLKRAKKKVEEKQKEDFVNPNNVRNTTFSSQKNGGISVKLTDDEIKKYVDGGYIVEDDISVPELNKMQPGGAIGTIESGMNLINPFINNASKLIQVNNLSAGIENLGSQIGNELPTGYNMSKFTMPQLINHPEFKLDPEMLSNMSYEDYANTLYTPSGELLIPSTDRNFSQYFSGDEAIIPASEEEYADMFNSRLDILNNIIDQKNKTGITYGVKQLLPNGTLEFFTPKQTISSYSIGNDTPLRYRRFAENPDRYVQEFTGLKQNSKNKWSFSDDFALETFDTKKEATDFAKNLLDDMLGEKTEVLEGSTGWSTTINPGQWRGTVQNIPMESYFRRIPGLEMSASTQGVFPDFIPRRGSGTYESLNEYLTKMDLGRIKSGFNSQTTSGKGAWENFIKSGKGYGYYNSPSVVHGILKKDGGIPQAKKGLSVGKKGCPPNCGPVSKLFSSKSPSNFVSTDFGPFVSAEHSANIARQAVANINSRAQVNALNSQLQSYQDIINSGGLLTNANIDPQEVLTTVQDLGLPNINNKIDKMEMDKVSEFLKTADMNNLDKYIDYPFMIMTPSGSLVTKPNTSDIKDNLWHFSAFIDNPRHAGLAFNYANKLFPYKNPSILEPVSLSLDSWGMLANMGRRPEWDMQFNDMIKLNNFSRHSKLMEGLPSLGVVGAGYFDKASGEEYLKRLNNMIAEKGLKEKAEWEYIPTSGDKMGAHTFMLPNYKLTRKYEDGGDTDYELGDELDLTPEQVAELEGYGYTLEQV
jgi:hypothetical protein